ncbi:MAG: T9SS type A sorting domain-containing protein [Bacteroidia bacterium]|nr:T9SS type A sorting domain-containing protein [Bacteroidia bacterium]
MKKPQLKSIIAAFCFSTLFTSAQPQLIKEYDLCFNSPIYELEADAQHFAKDGSFYLTGGSKNFGTLTTPIQDPVIVKLNSDGSLAGLNKRYSITGNQYATHITTIASALSSSETGYLLSGMTAIPGGGAEASNFFIKTDATGAVVWKKSFTLTTEDGDNVAMRITQVIQASNMKVYVVGMLKKDANYTTGNAELVIMKLNPVNGNIDWHKVYQTNSLSDIRATGIIEGQPGKFKVFGASSNSGAASFIFSFQESTFGLPISTSFKLISLSSGSLLTNEDITALHYYQNGYIVGGNIVTNIQNSVFLFRLDNNLNNPISLGGVTNSTNNYLHPNAPELTHITNNSAGLILTGLSSGALPYSSFAMLIGSNGSVINTRKGKANIEYATTSVDCFSEGSGFATLHHRSDGSKKSRFTKYSSLGFTCKDSIMPPPNSYNYVVSIITESPIEITRAMQTSIPGVIANDFVVTVTNICEKCATTPTAGPITTSTGGTTFCTGTPFTLFAPTGFSSYIWTHNGNAFGTGSSKNILTGGLYTVYMLDAAGCQAVQTISITSYSNCTINSCPPDVSYCSLTPASIPTIGWNSNPLSNCDGKWKFTWYYNGNQIAGGSYNTPFQGPGIYSVVALTPCGSQTCNINVTDQLIEYINHPSAQPNLTGMFPSPTFAPLTAPPAGLTYSWIVNNLTTSTQQTGTSNNIIVSPYATGDVLEVTLILTDIVKCKTYRNTITWSDNPARKFNTQLSGLKENTVFENGFQVSPNPASDKITITIEGFISDKKYKANIYSINGATIKTIDINKNNQTVDLNGIENGVYILELTEGEHSFRSRLIINK